MNMSILKGDIFYINKTDRNIGCEQEDGRPAVIVSNDTGNYYSEHVEVVYLTTKEKKPLPTHVKLVSRIPSTALCEQITTVSKERLGDFIRHISDDEMQELDKALKVSLALDAEESDGIKPNDKIQAMQAHIELLEGELEKSAFDNKKLQIDLAIMEKALAEKEPEPNTQMKIAQLEVERNTYKAMYEGLLDKVMKC